MESSKGHVPHSLENITQVLKGGLVVHYTCNPPNKRACVKYGIKPIGDKFGCINKREVVVLPIAVIEKANQRPFNRENIVLDCEQALRKLR